MAATDLQADAGMGRRERKRLATREAIDSSARELFSENGFDATTVADITERADVAERTFYRYFASKEAVALSRLSDLFDVLVAEIESEPIEHSPMHALGTVFERYAGRAGPRQEMVRLLTLIDEHPSVAAHQHYLLLGVQDRLAAHFAERIDVAAGALEPRLLAAAVVAVFQASVRTWAANGCQGTPWQYGPDALDAFEHGLGRISGPARESDADRTA